MGGDYSRSSFSALRDYAGVLMQQGHPTLDADWNEFVAIVERRIRAETVDIIGRGTVPLETPNGFEIQLAAGPTLRIGRGRIYVDGLLAENHGGIGAGAPPAFDRARLIGGLAAGVLDEPISTAANDFIDFTAQPYFPGAALPDGNGPHLAYVDVWQREVTPLKDPRLLEPALGGIDTATRWQSVWQVRLLANVGADAVCGSDIAAWDALVAPSPARLTNATIEFEDPDEPCLIPPGGGFRGLENQLYRVEIHRGGALGAAGFKWSRDNASVGASVESFAGNDATVVRRIGRDAVLRFRTGDWVEITDDRREFAGLSGDMCRVEVDEDSNTLRFDPPLAADLIPTNVGGDTAAARHSRVIRWDQSGSVLRPDGTEWTNLDDAGSDGLIPIPADGSPIVLEAGITVSFTVDPAGGNVRAGDCWIFSARTAGASIEPLENAPPHGVHHHYARLAVISFPATVLDCRIFWPPQFGEGEECACTICVSAEGHNSGALTIQAAINQLPEEGGSVCLGPGDFVLGNTSVVVSDKNSVRLRGQGPGTRLAYTGQSDAIHVIASQEVRVSDLALLVLPAGDNLPGAATGVRVTNGISIDIRQVVALVGGAANSGNFGIALDGFQLDVAIADNVVIAPIAVGSISARDGQQQPGYCALMEVSVADNILLARTRGISFDGLVLHLGATRIDANLITAGDAGVIATGAGARVDTGDDGAPDREPWSAAAVSISRNTLSVARDADGIVSGVPDVRILDNEIVASSSGEGDRRGSCVRLVAGLLPSPRPDGQIIGNRIGNAQGFGLSIESPQSTLMIKRNVIRDCAAGGLGTLPGVRIATLSFDNNSVEDVATRNVDGPLAAVRLSSVSDARIIGNSIRTVGRGSTQASDWAGFDLRGVVSLDLSHNTITGIGPANAPNPSIGVVLAGPLLATDISANRILDTRAPSANDPSSWAAILIDGEPDARGGAAFLNAGTASLPAYFQAGTQWLGLSDRGLVRVALLREAQIRVSGNIVSDAHRRSELPLVTIAAHRELTSGLVFSENQCTLLTEGGAKSLADLTAPRVIASSNVVRRRSDADAIHITCSVTGRDPAATVIGNITFGNIRVNGGNVPAAFAPLNILSA